MLDVSLRELEYVVAVDDERSFTRAALRLHMAQPALSQAIIRLERRLGVELFERSSRRVSPTPAGVRLAEHARDIISRVSHALDDLASIPAPPLRIHVSEPSLDTPRRLLFAIRVGSPGLSIHQTTLPRATVVDELRRGGLSVAIGEPVNADGIRCESIRSEQVGALVSATHPLATAPSLTPEDLATFPLVSIDDWLSPWNRWITAMMEPYGIAPTWTSSTVFGTMAGTDLVDDARSVLVSLESVGRDASSEYRWLPLDPATYTDWFMSWAERGGNRAAVKAAIESVRAFAAASGWSAQPGHLD